MLRLTWVQPEDLIGHELRQATQDGREPARIAARWRAAGGSDAPSRAGASAGPVSRYLRLLAEDLLDELADLPSRLADDEPTDPIRIRALCPDWPAEPAASTRPAPTPSAWKPPGWAEQPAASSVNRWKNCPSRPSANSPGPPATGP